MAKAYLVGDVTVTNPGPYVEYQEKVPALVAKYGGKYLVPCWNDASHGGQAWHRASCHRGIRVMDALRRFYESADYAPLLKLRKEATRSHVVFIEGYAAA